MKAHLSLAAATSAAIIILAGSHPANATAPGEGSTAPQFTLNSLSAQSFSLQQTRGHVVVVNFFATWCPPCRAETPDLIAAEKKYARQGVIFIGVDDEENPALVSAFAASKGIHYRIVLDSHGAVEHRYDVRAIPTTYILDRDGVIKYRQVDQLNVAVLDQALQAVVAGTPLPQSAAEKKFNDVAASAAGRLAQTLSSAHTRQQLDDAIKAGVAANKQLDALLAASDSSSINYFEQTQTRDKLNAQLADAYDQRIALTAQAASSTADREQAALLRGQIFTDEERYKDAAAQYAIAMQLAPKDTSAYDGAYLAAYELHDYAKAAQIAQSEAAIAPSDPESWLTLASANNSLKHYRDALAAERKALSLASETYARNPSAGSAAYELGRVWLKMARTEIMAGNTTAANAFLHLSSAAAPRTIVAQQADEQLVALAPVSMAIDRDGTPTAIGQTASPAHVYVVIRNPSAQSREVNLAASGLPEHWLLSFCYGTVCNPFKTSFSLPPGGAKRVELLVDPLRGSGGAWSMHVSASGTGTAHVTVNSKTTKAAITVTAS